MSQRACQIDKNREHAGKVPAAFKEKPTGPRNGPQRKSQVRKVVSGPIKSESPKPLIFSELPKIRESKNQRVLSRFQTKTKICESILQIHTI
jgi:hypothetical protein